MLGIRFINAGFDFDSTPELDTFASGMFGVPAPESGRKVFKRWDHWNNSRLRDFPMLRRCYRGFHEDLSS